MQSGYNQCDPPDPLDPCLPYFALKKRPFFRYKMTHYIREYHNRICGCIVGGQGGRMMFCSNSMTPMTPLISLRIITGEVQDRDGISHADDRFDHVKWQPMKRS